jgi:hypothetical protein
MMLAVGFFIGMFFTCAVIALLDHFRSEAPIAPQAVEPHFLPPVGEVIPFRSTRLNAKGSKLSVQALSNPSRGGNA